MSNRESDYITTERLCSSKPKLAQQGRVDGAMSFS